MPDPSAGRHAAAPGSPAAPEPRLTRAGLPLPASYDPVPPPDLAPPGSFPYVRGIYPEGYRTFPWMESFATGFGLPESTNARLHAMRGFGHEAYGGRASVNLVFDRPTFEGYDSDHPLARHEVGEVGVIVDSIHDVQRIFEGFDLHRLNVGFIVDRSGPPILAMYLGVADRLGIPREQLRGIVTNNPLEAYFISRMHVFPPRASLRMTADLTRYAVRNAPSFLTCRINGYNLRESGATPVQEVAYALAKGVAVVEECGRRGLSPDDAGERISFQFAQDSYLFEEVAKIRAARGLWARLMRDRLGARTERACRMKIHMQTSGASLTAQDPHNNVVRVALQTLSAALAGAQSVHVCAFDEALGIPTEEAVRLAVMTSKIVQGETGVADVADPLAGSWLLEDLTARLTAEVEDELARVDEMGGLVAAIENRYLESRIAAAAVSHQRAVETGERVVVGVNAHRRDGAAPPIPVFRPPGEDRDLAIDRCRALKRDRDARRAADALSRLRDAAVEDDGEIAPRLVDAAVAECTVGEMLATLGEVFGTWNEPAIIGGEGPDS